MSSSSQDIRLENRALRTLVEAQETTIAGLNEMIEAQETTITGLNEKTEAQETTIASLNETIRGLSSLDELHGGLALTNKCNPMLSEEIDDPDNDNLTAGAQETKINPRSGEHASHTLENASTGKGSGGMILESSWLNIINNTAMMMLKNSCIINKTGMMILKNRWLNIKNKAGWRAYHFTFVILGLVVMGSIFFLTEWSFVGDEPTVNAWWYLQAKCHMGQNLLQ